MGLPRLSDNSQRVVTLRIISGFVTNSRTLECDDALILPHPPIRPDGIFGSHRGL